VLLANTIIARNCNDGSSDPEIFCAESLAATDRDLRSDCAGTLDSRGFNLLGTRQNPGTNPGFGPTPLPPCDFGNTPIDRDHIGPFPDLDAAILCGQFARIGVLLAFCSAPEGSGGRVIQEVGRCQSNVAQCQDKHRLRDYLFPRLILVLLLGVAQQGRGIVRGRWKLSNIRQGTLIR
jgi:hypothetical protein